MKDNFEKSSPFSEESITLADIFNRQTNKEILATTALYGPWTPAGAFDWASYENLVRTVLESGSVPATNVDTTWAIYNDWDLTKNLIWRTAEIASEHPELIADDRPLIVAGLNTNQSDIAVDEIVPTLRHQLQEIDVGLRERQFSRIRYMPVPDKRLLTAPSATKLRIYQEIGQLIGEFTEWGLVFFELEIGISGFGSNFSASEIADILGEVPQIQEYKSAIIARKPCSSYPFDFRSDLVRIQIVESVCPERVQFSTGNDWFLALARLGKNIRHHGYLLGASQMSPALFKQWREGISRGYAEALALEHDLQAEAKDFWTPGNVGIYRHYLAIFLAMTGLITHPVPHPRCDERYRVLPEDYFLPLKHALRLGLVEPPDSILIARHFIPGGADLSIKALERRLKWLG